MRPEPITNIVKAVKVLLDENDVNLNVLVEDQDQIELDDVIKGMITPAVRYVHMNAPLFMLDGTAITTTPTTFSNGTGYINMPSDFMRPLILQMTTWAKPVTVFLDDTDPACTMQTSQYAGVRGNKYKPVCILTNGNNAEGSGLKRIDFYSVGAGETAVISRGRYIPYPQIGGAVGHETINICPNAYEAILYMTAGLTAQTIKDANANALISTAKELIQ